MSKQGLEVGFLQGTRRHARKIAILAGVADEHARPRAGRRGLQGETAFGRQPLLQLGQKRTGVRIFELDWRAALIEQDRLLAIDLGQPE